jgi:hypothetical protein
LKKKDFLLESDRLFQDCQRRMGVPEASLKDIKFDNYEELLATFEEVLKWCSSAFLELRDLREVQRHYHQTLAEQFANEPIEGPIKKH